MKLLLLLHFHNLNCVFDTTMSQLILLLLSTLYNNNLYSMITISSPIVSYSTIYLQNHILPIPYPFNSILIISDMTVISHVIKCHNRILIISDMTVMLYVIKCHSLLFDKDTLCYRDQLAYPLNQSMSFFG